MNPFNKSFALGLGAGLVLGIALPVLLPAMAEAGRPLAKALLKHTILGIERLKVSLARASESLDDFMAEVRAEVAEELAKNQPAQSTQAAAEPAPAQDAVPAAKVYS